MTLKSPYLGYIHSLQDKFYILQECFITEIF